MKHYQYLKNMIRIRYLLLLILAALLVPHFAMESHAASGKITITGSNVVAKGKKIQLKADQRVRWKSNKPSVAKVTANGKVKGIRVGTAIITATSRKNPSIKKRFRIRVKKKAAQRLRLSMESVTMDVTRATTAVVSAAVTPLNAAQVFEWTSSDPNTVDVKDGVLRALREGSAQITCRTVDGTNKRVTIPVTVTDKAREEREAAALEASYWNILLIGNSFTEDEFSYVPYLLKEYYPGLRFRIGILFQGGCTLELHKSILDNNGSYARYSEYTSEDTKWTKNSSVRLTDVLRKYNWKIVTLQQASGNQGDINTMKPYIQALMDGYARIIGNRPKYLYVFPHLRKTGSLTGSQAGKTTEEAYKDYASITQEIMRTFGFKGVIQNATAIENARKTSLGKLGDAGEMVHDASSHLQDGIPCLVANYCSFLSLLPHMGLSQVNLYDSALFPTNSWVNSQSVPGKHGNSVGVNYQPNNKLEPNKKLAADCARAAILKPYEITSIAA